MRKYLITFALLMPITGFVINDFQTQLYAYEEVAPTKKNSTSNSGNRRGSSNKPNSSSTKKSAVSSSNTNPRGNGNKSAKAKKSSNKGYRIEGNRIVTHDRWVVIDFYTDWCKYCPPYKEIFDRVGNRFSGKAIFIRINAEEKRNIANYYNVNSYPRTVVLYPNDRGVATEIKGLVDEDYLYNYLSRYF